jgi:beta-glucanase (GH16 family)
MRKFMQLAVATWQHDYSSVLLAPRPISLIASQLHFFPRIVLDPPKIMHFYAELESMNWRYPITPLVRAFCALLTLLPAALRADWVYVWGDEFDYEGEPDPSKWGYDLGRGEGGWGNGEVQTYTRDPENVRVEGGRLIIEARQVFDGRVPSYTSARLTTREKYSVRYGRIEVRAKLPSETGTWAAVWMLASDGLYSPTYWPNNGEIDIVEHVGYEEDPAFLAEKGVSYLNNIHATLHTEKRNHLTTTGLGGRTHLATASSDFHVYALDWYPNRMAFYVDDQLYFEIDKIGAGISVRNPPADETPWWPFTQRFHLLLNIAVGGSWGGHFRQQYYPTTPYGSDGINHGGVWPQRMEVDYVRVYDFGGGRTPLLNPVPGRLEANRHTAVSGLLFQRDAAAQSAIVAHAVDAGDSVDYAVVAAAAGDYHVDIEVASIASVRRLAVINAETGTELGTLTLGTSGGAAVWQWQRAGTVSLPQGRTLLRFIALDGQFRLGDLHLAAAPAGTIRGFPADSNGALDTGSWLGVIAPVAGSEWWYAPLIDTSVYPQTATDAEFSPVSQWHYIADPQTLQPHTDALLPWFYSQRLQRWCLTSAENVGDSPAWIFFHEHSSDNN